MDLILSTSSILGVLSNVYFHEKYLTDLKCDNNIVGIFSKCCRRVTIPNYEKKYLKLFNSQITLLVKIDENIYNVKLFRNGKVIVTGYKREDDEEFLEIINYVVSFIKQNISDKDIKLLKYYRILKNYKCNINTIINLKSLYQKLLKDNTFDIKNIIYSHERGEKITIKIHYEEYKTTIKIFYSGKINIDGYQTTDCVIMYMKWLSDNISESNEKL